MSNLGRFGTLVFGVGLALLAATAWAQSGQAGSVPAVGWTFWVNLAFGVLLTVVGAYVRAQNGRLEKLEDNYAELHRLVLRDYHSKHDLADILGEIKSSVKALHQRFDDILSNGGPGKRNG